MLVASFLFLLLLVSAVLWLSAVWIRRFIKSTRIANATVAILIACGVLLSYFRLPWPIPESTVVEAARPGLLASDLIAEIGLPHEMDTYKNGEQTYHYYADFFGITGIGVEIDKAGVIESTWVD